MGVCTSSRPKKILQEIKDIDSQIQAIENKSKKPLPVVSEKQLYKRFWEVSQRTVKHPNGPEVEYQLMGHPPTFKYVVVFPFHSKTKQVTLIRQWQQGLNQWWWQFPTGGHKPQNKDELKSGADELSEEARLRGGRWYYLIDEGKQIIETSFSKNGFMPLLVVDPVKDPNPRNMDAEEEGLIEIHTVDVHVMQRLIETGRMVPSSVCCAMLALKKLADDDLFHI
uniref:Nudix hydrolase domain-containing protein n=1 Tax=Lotharella oceanica TaxID=641309 RepID=A0A7S2TH60_9EUKA|mmetsp:Transcript_12240/g.23559  ORF Transcript_12240/g.23559 Transcript_12240/m.23559 type:complete len:224 (+) Transcript_12240:128-799(+)|eukprot:CAMPEP_0170189396 /NCGR_PEP_ID=MMETSP0040_2-20121228/46720_1 /TAXON_ID=641309 /ORGANISM="Lotharella oceanica, Strain CCMP622" /LENGTH=223 /DNA_ID=CAMNT_0010436959 /DNA_START=60 /DNA_END=731 /DNA_ORIENTATION=+